MVTAQIRFLSTTSLNSDPLSEMIASGRPCVESTCDYFRKAKTRVSESTLNHFHKESLSGELSRIKTGS